MIAILIPVLGRAHQIEPLLSNIHAASTTKVAVYFICSPADKEAKKACLASDATTIVTNWAPAKGDYAKKLSLGYRSTDEKWLFQGATDLLFHDGWDARALACHRASRRHVIGTNDLGNPLVVKGRHSTHTLVSRHYLDTYGGTVDGSGAIFSEVYDHQYSDTEFIETAIRRRHFHHCRNSVVEHLHPHWQKGENDDTYMKALRATEQDRRLFVERRRLFSHRMP